MDLLDSIFPELYRNALGWTLLHSVWQILAISLLLFLSIRLFDKKSAALKHNLGIAALALTFGSSVFTFLYYFQAGQETYSLLYALSESGWVPQEQLPVQEKSLWLSLKLQLDNHLPMLVNIWLVGAFLFAIRLAGNLAVIRNLQNDPKLELPDQWSDYAEKQLDRMGIKRKVRVCSCILSQTPITFGSLKPIVLIPAGLLFHLNPAQLEAIITHELAHVKRQDYLVNLLQSILEVVYFYHPCFWWINSLIREQREIACDDLAIHHGIKPNDLARGLAEVLNQDTQDSPEIALAAARKQHPTLARIKKMMGYESEKPQIPSLITLTMILSLLISASLVVACAQKELTTTTSEQPVLATQHHTLNEPPALQDTIPQEPEAELEQPPQPEKPAGPRVHFIDAKNIFKGDTLSRNAPIILFKDNLNDSLFSKLKILGPDVFKFKVDTLDKEKMERIERLLQENALKMELSSAEMEKHVQIWQERNQHKMEALQQRLMEKEAALRERSLEMQAELEPRMKEFEQKMQQWHENNQPKLEELQKRLQDKEVVILERKTQEIQAELEPKLKELEEKIQEWQQDFGPKMEEFQQRMETWQKKNEQHFQDLEKMLKEAFSEKEKPAKNEP